MFHYESGTTASTYRATHDSRRTAADTVHARPHGLRRHAVRALVLTTLIASCIGGVLHSPSAFAQGPCDYQRAERTSNGRWVEKICFQQGNWSSGKPYCVCRTYLR